MSVAFSTPATILPPTETPTELPCMPVYEDLQEETTNTSIPVIYPQNKPQYYCSCVEGLRYFGIDLPPRPFDAKNFIGNAMPSVGGVVIFYYADSNIYHVALIVEMYADYMLVREWNYEPCEETWRRINYDDKAIFGFSNF